VSRILILVANRENRNLLAEALGAHHELHICDEPAPNENADLCVVDGVALDRWWQWISDLKHREIPVFQPCLLVTPRAGAKLTTRRLWQVVDEVLVTPAERAELQARVAVLLRARQYSIELERRLRSLFESVPAGLVRLAPDGTIVDANPALAGILGFGTPAEVLGKHLPDLLVSPDEWHGMPHGPGDVEGRWHHEVQLRRSDGGTRWVNIDLAAVTTNGGVTSSFDGTVQDVTERHSAEDAFHRTYKALRTVSLCNETLVHAEHEEGLLFDMCAILVDSGGYHSAWVGTVKEPGMTRLNVAAAAGAEGAGVDSVRAEVRLDTTNPSPASLAATTLKKCVATDQTRDERIAVWRTAAHEGGIASSIALPLTAEGALIGILGIDSTAQGSFAGDELELLDQLANDIAYGMASLRARASLRATQQSLNQSFAKTQRLLNGILHVIESTIEIRDPYTSGHQRRVAELAVAIARHMGLPEETCVGPISMAASIHDIGKLAVPTEILSKPGRLSDAEFTIIKTHPQVGYDILKEAELPDVVAQVVLQHHERLDGSGYPQRLSGDDILPEAQILAVADVVEAMSSHRPYRPALGIDAALKEVEQGVGVKYYPDVVAACVALIREQGFAFSPQS